MATGYSVALPLTMDEVDGFNMNKSALAAAKQNLKMLLLTSPGERTMLSNYGVGIKRYLFQNMTSSTLVQIKTRIIQQVRDHLPYIEIRNILFSSPIGAENNVSFSIDENFVGMRIIYRIPGLVQDDFLDLIAPKI
mgnify:CR=1 FL=1|tara:strand:- start:3304 stop:3711 length:408 start_codon:yes stop_codon:yes gene_type:complete